MRDATKPLPYYRWYPGDHRASARVQDLTYVEEGLYRRLLDECWRVGYIPDDPIRLARICRAPVGVVDRAWRHLRDLFISVEGLDGQLLTSERLELERTQEDRKRVQRMRAGQASAAKRNGRSTLVNERYIAVAVAEESSSTDAGPIALAGTACAVCGGRQGIHDPACVRA
jgi:uncharacterized protein YdaU (DUF1376 family)